MTDMTKTIAPKSDQMNADDLIGGSVTIRVTGVKLCGEADQPIAIHYEGDNGKPFKPCKSMRRVMVNAWGGDGNQYAGRSMTLYRDDKVQFGGLAVGGIRISHMSHIDRDITMALTASRANRKPFTVKPLKAEAAKPKPADPTFPDLITRAADLLADLPSRTDVGAIRASFGALQRAGLKAADGPLYDKVMAACSARVGEIEMASADEREPGDDG